jgi:Tfp pilus assembly protein PilO
MKDLVGKLLSKLHLIFFLYGAWSIWEIYSTHTQAMEEIITQKPTIEEEIKKSRQKLSQIDEFRKNVEQSKNRVQEVFSNIDRVQRQLPAEINDIEVLDFLSREGRTLNMPEIEPNPLIEQPMGFYISKQYGIKARGTFLQFVVFLERLNSAERLFNVRSFKIEAPTGEQKGRFQVVNFDGVIDTYKYNSAHKETSGLEELDAKADKAAEEK